MQLHYCMTAKPPHRQKQHAKETLQNIQGVFGTQNIVQDAALTPSIQGIKHGQRCADLRHKSKFSYGLHSSRRLITGLGNYVKALQQLQDGESTQDNSKTKLLKTADLFLNSLN